MKRNIITCGLCTLVLMAHSTSAAPRRSRSKPAKKPVAAKVAKVTAPVSEIRISEQSGTDVRGFGVATTWTLRSNGTIVREGNLPGENMGDPGASYREQGAFDRADFQPLAAFLEWSKLLDQKVHPSQEMEGYTSFSIVRGGKRREISIPDSAPATSASWATMRLLRAITSGVDWKNGAGLSVNTGLSVELKSPSNEVAPDFDGMHPAFSVRNASGKEVALVQRESESLYIRQVLPPGQYEMVPYNSTDAQPNAKGLVWRASPAKFEIVKGRFTDVSITLVKAAAP